MKRKGGYVYGSIYERKRKDKDKQLIAYVRKDIETVLHREYKGKRIKGEWFNLTDTEINKIISTYSFERPGVLFI